MALFVCHQCGVEFHRRPSQNCGREVAYCSRACWYQFQRDRPRSPNAYRGGLYLPDHPIAPAAGRVPAHRVILYDSIGPGRHPCHWCGKEVHWRVNAKGQASSTDLVVDHVDGNKANNTLSNLVPSCHGCNVLRVRTDLIGGAPSIPRADGKGSYRAEERMCGHCDSPFLAPVHDKRPNRGVFCSRSCARRSTRRG